jgi:hypothetical protein
MEDATIMKTMLILITCLCILVSCGSSTSNQGTASTPPATNTVSPPTPPPSQHAHVGQTVNVGNVWMITITSAIIHLPPATPEGGSILPSKSGDVWLVFQTSVKNISPVAQRIAGLDFSLRDTAGEQYGLSYPSDAGYGLGGKVEAGAPLKGIVSFEVPPDVHDYRLAFENETIAPGQTIWDVQV